MDGEWWMWDVRCGMWDLGYGGCFQILARTLPWPLPWIGLICQSGVIGERNNPRFWRLCNGRLLKAIWPPSILVSKYGALNRQKLFTTPILSHLKETRMWNSFSPLKVLEPLRIENYPFIDSLPQAIEIKVPATTRTGKATMESDDSFCPKADSFACRSHLIPRSWYLDVAVGSLARRGSCGSVLISGHLTIYFNDAKSWYILTWSPDFKRSIVVSVCEAYFDQQGR